MLKTIQRITIGFFLLIIMPSIIGLSGWTWQPGEHNNTLLYIMYWITQTVTYPWGILTTFFLTSYIFYCLRFNWRYIIILFFIINITLLTEQYIKSYIKRKTQIQRPYIVWIEKKYHINKMKFNKLTNKKKSVMIYFLLKNNIQIPQWLKIYWTIETDFSFPSGHTIFASSWMLFFIGLSQTYRRFLIIVALFFWTDLVMSSRLLLGMHWPGDLFIGILISWLSVIFAILSLYFLKKLMLKDNNILL